MLEVASRACPHAGEHGMPSLVCAIKWEHGRVVVIRRTQPVALRRQQIAACDGPVGAFGADIASLLPFLKPGLLVIWIDPVRGEEAFRNRRATFLSCSQEP